MKRIDERESMGASYIAGGLAPRSELRPASTMMVEAIIDELADLDVDLETVTLSEMKQLFANACRDA